VQQIAAKRKMATEKCDTSWPLVNVIICHNVRGMGRIRGSQMRDGDELAASETAAIKSCMDVEGWCLLARGRGRKGPSAGTK